MEVNLNYCLLYNICLVNLYSIWGKIKITSLVTDCLDVDLVINFNKPYNNWSINTVKNKC